ncbi:MAG: NAD(P)-dependent oxidoreductase [Sinobacterium sp.]|nr:NAD(P)-dependent oxidoreductase [Sinobacterium sp.]
MKVLIVGGTGLIGAEAALHLKTLGHHVTLMARKPTTVPLLQDFSFIQCDYIHDDVSDGRLKGFDVLLFSAAADIRNIPQDGSVTPSDFYTQANDEAVPKFFQAAKDAGIKQAIYIGTFYPEVAPEKIGQCAYVTSRHNTCEAIMALHDANFKIVALNAPFVLGQIDGLEIPHLDALVAYAKGFIPELPLFAPQGGTNHISSKSIAQACGNIIAKNLGGKAYLIGDENYTWNEYLTQWFELAGNATEFITSDEEHPMFPNIIMFAGVGATVSYEPYEETLSDLEYSRQQIKATMQTLITAFDAKQK